MDGNTLLAMALRHHQAGRLNDAEGLYRQILLADPQHTDALHFLGVAAHQLGRNEQAVELISQAIAHNSRVPAFHNNLGNALRALAKLPEAAASYRRALTLKPDHVEALYNLATTLQERGLYEEAVLSYKQALKLNPRHAEAYNNLGNALQAQGKLQEAIASYRSALSCRPNHLDAQINLGNVFQSLGQLEQALGAYGHALALRRDCAEAHHNIGLVLQRQSRLDEAVGAYRRALECKPDYPEVCNNLGNALLEQGRMAEAMEAYGQALALKPDYAEARLGQTLATIPVLTATAAEGAAAAGHFARALDELAGWNADHPGLLGRCTGRQPFYLAYRPFDVTALLSRYGDLTCAAASVAWRHEALSHHGPIGTKERIRLGIVSGQVRARHPVWEVALRGIIAHLDRAQFEIVLYNTDPVADEEAAWAATHVGRFVQGPKSSQAWLDEIARDRPDVLFYPQVGMDPATCTLASLRLAPVQVAGWGHPVTTGLPTLDLFVSGELIEGVEAARHYREKLVRLPGTGVCTELAPIQPQRWPGPERAPGVVRFLCQQPIKCDPADDVLLTRIAQAVGACEFWLTSPDKLPWSAEQLFERLAAAFCAAGLDPQAHLRRLPWLPRPQFAGFLNEMDVYLDCPAFSGYTTAWQAVHRGVPIVTVEGEFMRQRLAAGVLRQIGVLEGIAASREEYVAIAVRWGEESRDPARRAARRATVRQAAPKADGNRSAVDAFGRVLIEALRRC